MDLMVSMPLRPAFMASQVDARSLPKGLITPMPVITILRSVIISVSGCK